MKINNLLFQYMVRNKTIIGLKLTIIKNFIKTGTS